MNVKIQEAIGFQSFLMFRPQFLNNFDFYWIRYCLLNVKNVKGEIMEISCCWKWKQGRWIEHREFLGPWKYSVWDYSDWVNVIIHFSKPIECATPRVNSNVNYRLHVIVMCQCGFIFVLKKCTILVSNIDNGGGYTCVWAGHMGKMSIFLSILL